jgi:putative hemolysin
MNSYGAFSSKWHLVLVAILLGAGILCQGVLALINPSATYCIGLNYTYSVTTGPEGGQYGTCILPNNQAVDAWQFLEGRVGQEYSYCERNNYSVHTVTDATLCAGISNSRCTFCVLLDGTEVEVTRLMNLSFREPNLIIEPPSCTGDTCSLQAPSTPVPTTVKSPLSLVTASLALTAAILLLRRRT